MSIRQKIKQNQFAVTAELVPPLTVEPNVILSELECLKGRVDGINVTDGAGARTNLSSLAVCAVMARAGYSPILQMTCRDRNRLALMADLLSANLLGIEDVLILTGDDPAQGDQPQAKPVFDMSSTELMRVASTMSRTGDLPTGRTIEGTPSFFVGAAAVPEYPVKKASIDKLKEKIDSGAEFIQTQFCFDVELTRGYVESLSDAGITNQASVFLGVGPIRSSKSARWMNDNLFGVTVPEHTIQRLESSDTPREEGIRLCAESIATFREWAGVAGVHIMAPAQKASVIAQVLDRL